MAVEHVELRVKRRGFVVNGGDLSTTVDLSDAGNVDKILGKLLRAAADRDGHPVSDYVMDVYVDSSLHTTYVTA